MKKHVSELTPEELQRTFPIVLKETNPDYSSWYEEEEKKIRSVLPEKNIVRINHIGSTAIPNIKAKPIVDILLEMDGACPMDEAVESLKGIEFGVEILRRRDDPFELLMAKGMTVNGFAEKVFLLHLRRAGNWDELYFRDDLLDHPDAALEYSRLKEQILTDIQNGKIQRMPNGQPNGYSKAKLAFVTAVSRKAKEGYGNRYSLA